MPPRKSASAGRKKSSTARKAGGAKKSTTARSPIRRIVAATSATMGVDDKRAQYARLVVFNYGQAKGLIAKGKDVNSVSKGDLEKAGKELNGGTLLKGKEGIELIQKHSQKGATDAKVADRGLTTAYAQEVRPFIMRLQFSDSFGRRGKKPVAEASA